MLNSALFENFVHVYGIFLACDEEMFEDNPDEYIRRDIEGSDVDTRRKAACDLIKVLAKFLEPQIKTVFLTYVQVRGFFLRIVRFILDVLLKKN